MASKKQKWYYYTIKNTRDGDEKVRNIPMKTSPDQVEEIFKSRMSPSARQMSQEWYNEYGEGRASQGGGFGENYADVVRAGQAGGQKSSRRKWDNEADKQVAKRLRKKFLQGREMNNKDITFMNKYGIDYPKNKKLS